MFHRECRLLIDKNDECGIDICLTTFEGFCSKNGHAQAYCQNSGNNIFIRYKTIEIEEQNETRKPQKVTKLAIGMEGGIDFSQKKKEVFLSCYCHACNTPQPIDSISHIAEEIKMRESAYKKTETAAWEQTIVPCEHTRSLDQNQAQRVASANLAKCGLCELNQNLWICLHCGHLGCGRKYFDGTGGNGHAVDHFKTTGHAVAVKTGTISAEGNASIFCYHCDDDVKDEALREHLKTLGIEVNEMQKTEKTMAEIVTTLLNSES